MNREEMVVNAIRILSAEAVQKAKSGHPGMPMGSAAMAYALWGHELTFNPADTKWANRDRFVLSSGHGSMLMYSLLHLFGLGVTIEDIKNFRQLNSRTPGHPEVGHTAGVECTTGPLGMGICNAVGMAAAEAHLAAHFNREGFPVVDHRTYAICGDGCLMEGLSHECAALAGTWKLNKLTVLYDDNEISIEGNTDIAFREDVPARFRAYGWNVIDVRDADHFENVVPALELAKVSDKPTLIVCHTTIGFGAPTQGQAKTHGEPLGEDNIRALKKNLGWIDEEPMSFAVPDEVYQVTNEVAQRGARAQANWQQCFDAWSAAYPELRAEWDAWFAGACPIDVSEGSDFWAFDGKMATRNASGVVLNRIAPAMTNLIGGSADLAPSNKTYMKNAGDFSAEDYSGRNMHFGVREHAMACIAAGMQLHGGLHAYCATFFVFSDYMKNAMRVAALSKAPVTYVLTHDSIGVGEDGPTHQPIEHLAGLRAIPDLIVYRPADAKETAAGWYLALTGNRPVALVLTRQDLPLYEKSGPAAFKGGYILSDCEGTPDVLLLASGSELGICVEAQAQLKSEGIAARVVSMPSFELFNEQDEAYRESVIPSNIRARVAVEAASRQSWYQYVGLDGAVIGIDTFGASAPFKTLYEMYGFTAENVADAARKQVKK